MKVVFLCLFLVRLSSYLEILKVTVPRWDRFESKRHTQGLKIFLFNFKIKLKHQNFKISYIETGTKIKKNYYIL